MVKRLPLAALIGGDILAPHQWSFNYVVGERKRLNFGTADCPVCRKNRRDPEQRIDVQGRFIEADVSKKRNRVRLPCTFVAVLPSAKNNTRAPDTPDNKIGVIRDSDTETESPGISSAGATDSA